MNRFATFALVALALSAAVPAVPAAAIGPPDPGISATATETDASIAFAADCAAVLTSNPAVPGRLGGSEPIAGISGSTPGDMIEQLIAADSAPRRLDPG